MSGKIASPKARRSAIATLCLLSATMGVYARDAHAANPIPIPNTESAAPMSLDTKKLLQDAEAAQSRDQLGLAIVQLKNAVRLSPRNGEVRARLGIALMRAGDTRTAQRELQQARKDNAPDELVIPAIMDSMVVRGEARDLLEAFPEPSSVTPPGLAADILRARALAFQILGRSTDANTTIARSLSLRRDTKGLLAKAKLAMEQNDIALARNLIDEAAKLTPTNEEVLVSQVSVLFRSGDPKKTLAAADDFIRRTPNSTIGRAMRIEALLALNLDKVASDDIDTLEEAVPDSSFIPYYRGLIFARAGNFKDAWHQVETLHPEFVLGQPAMALLVAEIAIASGNIESGGAILTTLVSRRPALKAARVRLAAVLLQLRSPDKALDVLDSIKTDSDPETQALFGQASMQVGRYGDAIGSLERAIDSGAARNPTALQLGLAESAFGYGDVDRAIHALEQVRAHEQTDWQTAVPLVLSFMQAGRYQEALGVLDGMAKTVGRTPLVPFYRARVLAAQGDLAAASAAFGDALEIDPKFVPALYFRAHVLVGRGNVDGAKKDLNRIIAQDSTNIYAYTALAQIALLEGQDVQSIALLNRAIQASPKDLTPRFALATEQINSAKYPDAQATLNALLKLSPNNPIAVAQIGQIQFRTGQTDRAIDTFRSLAATYQNVPGVYVMLAKALDATKDRLAAIDAARRAVELDPLSVRTRAILVQYLFVAGRRDDALANAREFASAHPGPEADLLVVSTLMGMKRADDARTYLTSRLAAKPDRLLALRLSEIAMEQGDRKKATSVLADWLRLAPNDIDVRKQYGAVLLQAGDAAAGRKEFEALLKLRPEDPVVLSNLAWILRDEDPAHAYDMASLAVKIAPNAGTIVDTLGWMKFERRDFQGAVSLLRRAHQLDGGNGQIAYHFAVALDATGQRTEAKSLLQSTIAQNQDFTDKDSAKQMLARW